MRVAVVGAGLAGLAAALHLRGRGHEVTVVERESIPGGRYGTLERDGFRFDTGPVVFTMTELLDEAFAAVGRKTSDYVELNLLDPAYRGFFADGRTLRVRSGYEDMRAEILAECGSSEATAFDGFVDWLTRLNDVELANFIDANFDSPLDLLRSPSAALELLRLRGFSRLNREVNRRFTDERLRRLFSFQAMYAGVSPTKALALFAVITYMDSVKGVYFPTGGMHAVPRAMAKAAADSGVEFRYNSTVERIRRNQAGAVAGLELAEQHALTADAVIVTGDLPVVYPTLLPDVRPPFSLRKPTYSPSALVWHVGVRGDLPPQAGHHNIHFGHEWDKSFKQLIDQGRPMSDPSRYVAVPSIHDPGAAPDGHHTLYVLEPVPNLEDGQIDWGSEGPRLRDRLQRFLEANGYPTEIVTEELVTPADWFAQGMAAGTPFALSHTFTQSGPFRPRNVDPRIPGLAFAGSTTTPGVGIPMVLISGKLAADRVERRKR